MTTKNFIDTFRLQNDFFQKDVLSVAPQLLGKTLVRKFEGSGLSKYKITDVEAYRGEEDLACHVSKGKTKRNEVMYNTGGCLYVYLIYGMYWMLNIVASVENNPQAVLLRGFSTIQGPGRLSKELQIDKTFNAESLQNSERIWIEDAPLISNYKTSPRVGIDYAASPWKEKPWRFYL